MRSDERVTAAGGFCAPMIAAAFGVPEESLYHCRLCASAPVRIFSPFEEAFYVISHREPLRWRWLMRLMRLPTEWHEVVYWPASPPLHELLPAFTATRGGVSIT